MKRILTLAAHFGIRALVLINKYDINEEISHSIEDEAKALGAGVVGMIPYEEKVIEAVKEGQTIIEYGLPEIESRIRDIWARVEKTVMEPQQN
jgi:MinD superfamily P-loop ATPase